MKIIKLIGNIGINGAIVYTALGRIIQGLGGLFSIVLVAMFLTKSEQGFYYTFTSFLAIQIFFELGLSNIIVQFTAHETAHSEIDYEENVIRGSSANMSRLSSLLRFSIKWFLIMSILLFVGLLIFGFYFFTRHNRPEDTISWQIPWVILCFSTAFSLFISPILSFLEGLGFVKKVAFIRLVQITLQLIFLSAALAQGFRLFSYPVANLCSLAIIPLLIFRSNLHKLLFIIWKNIGNHFIDYKKEIFPLQWKISISWISGFFIYQLFTPLVFANSGSVAAGQMGMTLAIVNGILVVSISWINTKIPVFSQLIAQSKFAELDHVFKTTFIQSTILSALGLVVFLSSYKIMQYYQINYYKRFLSFALILPLTLAYFINQIISSLAIYLRCHKKEPMLIYSVISGIVIGLSSFLFSHIYGVTGLIFSFSTIIICACFPWAVYIFITKRKEWHSTSETSGI